MSKVAFQYLLTNLISKSFTIAPSDKICDDHLGICISLKVMHLKRVFDIVVRFRINYTVSYMSLENNLLYVTNFNNSL